MEMVSLLLLNNEEGSVTPWTCHRENSIDSG